MILLALLPLLMLSCGQGKTGYSGEDLTGKVSIERNPQDKSAWLQVNTGARSWKIFAGPAVEYIDMKKPILKGDSDGRYRLPVDNSGRSYFQLSSDGSGAILAERRLPMEGGFNFRDLGGYRTRDGRHVKWGKILRSDDLHNLTSADLDYLASIPVNTIVDFRSPAEISQAPDRLPSSDANRYELSITPGDMSNAVDYMNLSEDQVGQLMKDMNIMFVSDPQFVLKYKQFFALLQQESNAPLMFHCTAGKDRTGMGAALVLYALGVDDETIMEDYTLSNVYLRGKYDDIIDDYPNLKPLMTVDPAFLQAGIDRIRDDHGTVENFLSGTLGVNLERFREMYLYQ